MYHLPVSGPSALIFGTNIPHGTAMPSRLLGFRKKGPKSTSRPSPLRRGEIRPFTPASEALPYGSTGYGSTGTKSQNQNESRPTTSPMEKLTGLLKFGPSKTKV